MGLLQPIEADTLWADYLRLPIEFVDTPLLRVRAWQLARQYELLTLYDAAFMACMEGVLASVDAERECWTADQQLLNSLGAQRPAYVRQLGR